jgi:hypothetical protein
MPDGLGNSAHVAIRCAIAAERLPRGSHVRFLNRTTGLSPPVVPPAHPL